MKGSSLSVFLRAVHKRLCGSKELSNNICNHFVPIVFLKMEPQSTAGLYQWG